MVGTEGKSRESFKDANQSGSDSGDGRWLGDEEPRPGVEKSSQRSITVADVDILATCLRLHGAQFSVGERPEEGKQSTCEPGQVNQLCRTGGLHHLGRYQKNSTADDGAHHNCAGMA